MPLWPASKIRVSSWAERPRRFLRSDDATSFSSNKITPRSSSYSSVTPSSGSILIVDDDASVRRALHITLQTLGFGTAEAPGGEEALMLARAGAYDVVLLDINLPGLDGFETCRQLRRIL